MDVRSADFPEIETAPDKSGFEETPPKQTARPIVRFWNIQVILRKPH